MWRDVSQVFKVIDRVKKIICWDKIFGFFAGLNLGEKEGEKERNPSLFSVILKVPSSHELKFISSMKATHTYQEQGISPKIQMRRFGETKGFGLRDFLERSKRYVSFLL